MSDSEMSKFKNSKDSAFLPGLVATIGLPQLLYVSPIRFANLTYQVFFLRLRSKFFASTTECSSVNAFEAEAWD